MGVLDLIPVGLQAVCELTGIDTALTPDTAFPRPVNSADQDLLSVDILLPFATGYNNETAFIGGDAVGSNMRWPVRTGGPFGWQFTTSTFTSTVFGTQPTRAASSFVGDATNDWIRLPTLPTEAELIGGGMVSVATGTGPGGVAIFSYDSVNIAAPQRLMGVKLQAGGGNVVAGQAVYCGDPRSGFRGSPLAMTSDTDWREGPALTFKTNPSPSALETNVAWDSFPFPGSGGDRYGAGRTLQSRAEVFPRVGGAAVLATTVNVSTIAFTNGVGVIEVNSAIQFAGSAAPATMRRVTLDTGAIVEYTDRDDLTNQLTGCTRLSGAGTSVAGSAVLQSTALGTFRAVAGITKNAGSTAYVIETATAHPLTDDLPIPIGPLVIMGGVTTAFGSCRTAGQNVASLAGGRLELQAVPTDFVSGASASPKNRFIVQTTTGWATLSYTGKDTGATPALTGCVLISGSGTTFLNGQVCQGPTRPDPAILGRRVSLDLCDALVFDTHDAAGAQSTTHFRISIDTVPYAGGDPTSAFVFFPYNVWTDPINDPRDGEVMWGGCSVPRVASTHGRRLVAFTQGTLWHGIFTVPVVNCTCWTSDDYGATWQKQYTFENDEWFNAPVMGVTPYTHTDGYVYAFATPGNILMRIPHASVHLKASWEYLHIPGDNTSWSSTIPDPVTAKLLSLRTNNNLNLTYVNHATQPYWLRTYQWGFTTYVDTAADPWGPWSTRRPLASIGTFDNGTFANGILYGCYPAPTHINAQAPLDDDQVCAVATLFNSYDPLLLTFSMIDPGDAPVTKQQAQDIEGSGGRLVDAELESATFYNPNGWFQDRHVWTRSGANQFTIPVDATSTGENYLKKWMRGSVIDNSGTRRYFHVLSFSVASGVTTVNVVPHNDGSSAGNVFAAGAFTTGIGEYSYHDAPVGWPGWFSFTSTPAGFSADPSTVIDRFKIDADGTVYVNHEDVTFGTSNATTYTRTLPVTARTQSNIEWAGACTFARNNSTNLTGAARWRVQSGATVVSFHLDMSGAALTASNEKGHRALYHYEAA